MFSAVRLVPSESLYASSVPDFLPDAPGRSTTSFSGLAQGAFGVPASTEGMIYQQPLHLWGLTLGVLADFLDMLPPHNAVKLWTYPTFVTPDLRVFIYLFTRSVRNNNAGDLSSGSWLSQSSPRRRRPSQTAMDATSQAIAVTEGEPTSLAHNNVGIGGLGVGADPKHAVAKLLSGYYERMNVAIGVFLFYRALLGAGVGFWLYRMWRKRTQRSML